MLITNRIGVLLPRLVYPPLEMPQELPDVGVVPPLRIAAARPAVTQAVQGRGRTDRRGIEGRANLLRLTPLVQEAMSRITNTSIDSSLYIGFTSQLCLQAYLANPESLLLLR